MAGAHDELAAAQAGTYASLDVRLFEHRLLEHRLFEHRLLEHRQAIGPPFGDPAAPVLRLKHVHVPPGDAPPSADAEPGMLGALVAERDHSAGEFLIAVGLTRRPPGRPRAPGAAPGGTT